MSVCASVSCFLVPRGQNKLPACAWSQKARWCQWETAAVQVEHSLVMEKLGCAGGEVCGDETGMVSGAGFELHWQGTGSQAQL